MADVKISGLPVSTTPLAGSEVLPIVQSGQTKQVSVANLTAARSVSALSITTTNDSSISGLTVGKGAGALSGNTVVGTSALENNTTGDNNTAVGTFALVTNSTGVNNTAVGYTALFNTTSSNNTALGLQALSTNSTGANNAANGVRALTANTTGNNNTAAGYQAGSTLTTGSNNAFFGSNAQPSAVDVSNEYTYGDANVTKHRFVGGDIVIGTAGKGIDFSADGQAAGMTSELLNDYEEGTWTPTFIGSGGNPTVTFTTQLGSYTKAGRLVFIKLDILVNSTSGGSGNLSVGGLPFVNSAINSGLSNAFVFNFVVSPLNYHVVSGSDSIALFQDTITNTPSTVADLQASAFLRISGCYSV